MNSENYVSIISHALEEDIQTGDITSLAIFTSADMCTAQLIAKQDGIIAGLAVFKKTFELVHEKIQVILHYEDGQSCQKQMLLPRYRDQ